MQHVVVLITINWLSNISSILQLCVKTLWRNLSTQDVLHVLKNIYILCVLFCFTHIKHKNNLAQHSPGQQFSTNSGLGVSLSSAQKNYFLLYNQPFTRIKRLVGDSQFLTSVICFLLIALFSSTLVLSIQALLCSVTLLGISKAFDSCGIQATITIMLWWLPSGSFKPINNCKVGLESSHAFCFLFLNCCLSF